MLGPANSSHRVLGHKVLGSAFPWVTKQATGEGVGPGWGPLSTKAEVTQELTFHSARGRPRTDGISVMKKLAVQEGSAFKVAQKQMVNTMPRRGRRVGGGQLPLPACRSAMCLGSCRLAFMLSDEVCS